MCQAIDGRQITICAINKLEYFSAVNILAENSTPNFTDIEMRCNFAVILQLKIGLRLSFTGNVILEKREKHMGNKLEMELMSLAHAN